VFDDGYYCDNVDKEKPVFTDDDDDGLSVVSNYPHTQHWLSSYDCCISVHVKLVAKLHLFYVYCY